MNNPVLQRETLLLLRQPRLLPRLWMGWALLAVVVVVLWPEGGGGAEERRWIFRCFALGQLLTCVLLAPSITAPLITDEKENDRFCMLFASLLTPFDVLMGKGLSSLIVLGFSLLSGLPFLVLVLVLGGVAWIEVFQVYLICFAALVQFGVLGLTLSCVKDRTYNALLASYAWMLVLAALTWLPGYLLGGFKVLAPVWALLRSLSPFSAMMDVVAPEVLVILGRLPDSWSIGELWSADLWAYLLLSSVFSIVFLGFCLRRVFLLPLGQERGVSRADMADPKKKRFPYILINPDKTRKPFGVGSLIFVKELRCKLFGYMGNLIRGIYSGLFISISLVILVSLNVQVLSLDAVKIVGVTFQMGIILLLTPALTASAVSEELQSGTLEMLRMTPVSAWRFWNGKVRAGNAYMIILLLSSSPIYFMLGMLEVVTGGEWTVVLQVLAVQGLLLLLCSTCGVWWSAWVGQTQKAVGLSYGSLLVLSIFPFVVSFLELPREVVPWLQALSPFLVATELVTHGPQLTVNHAILMGAVVLLMLVHSLWMVNRHMRQAQ